MIVGTEKVSAGSGWAREEMRQWPKCSRQVERWSPVGAPRKSCLCAGEEPEDHKGQSYPCKTKSSHETEKRVLKFLEPSH